MAAAKPSVADPSAAAAAAPPAPAKARARGLPVRFNTVIKAVPTITLGGGFWMMIFHEVPEGNQTIVLAIASGLLGYLTHAVQTHIGKGEG